MFLHMMLIQQQCVKLNYIHLPERGNYIDCTIKTPHEMGFSLVAQSVMSPPAMQKTWFPSLDGEVPLEKGMATHSSILAWRIPWTRTEETFTFHTSSKWFWKSSSMVSWERNLTLCVCVCVCVCLAMGTIGRNIQVFCQHTKSWYDTLAWGQSPLV